MGQGFTPCRRYHGHHPYRSHHHCLTYPHTHTGQLEFPIGPADPVCLIAGKSPRGTHRHVVVATTRVPLPTPQGHWQAEG